jgi:hypothetical protein
VGGWWWSAWVSASPWWWVAGRVWYCVGEVNQIEPVKSPRLAAMTLVRQVRVKSYRPDSVAGGDCRLAKPRMVSASTAM